VAGTIQHRGSDEAGFLQRDRSVRIDLCRLATLLDVPPIARVARQARTVAGELEQVRRNRRPTVLLEMRRRTNDGLSLWTSQRNHDRVERHDVARPVIATRLTAAPTPPRTSSAMFSLVTSSGASCEAPALRSSTIDCSRCRADAHALQQISSISRRAEPGAMSRLYRWRLAPSFAAMMRHRAVFRHGAHPGCHRDLTAGQNAVLSKR
jgi:hypothetical protein